MNLRDFTRRAHARELRRLHVRRGLARAGVLLSGLACVCCAAFAGKFVAQAASFTVGDAHDLGALLAASVSGTLLFFAAGMGCYLYQAFVGDRIRQIEEKGARW